MWSMILVLLVLLLISAFFSGSETGMMSINRYRLRHQARKGNRMAQRVLTLLQRPDRLLGVILIGNTFANVLASAVVTLMAAHYFGRWGIFIASIALTLLILIFSETTPKTFAALHPQRFAFFCSRALQVLLVFLYPLVFLVNVIANGILRLCGVSLQRKHVEPLSLDELRSVVNEAKAKISPNFQGLLLRVLDLEKVTVEHVMVPRSDIQGIDLEQEWPDILKKLISSERTYLPVYRHNIDKVEGVLNLKQALLRLLPGAEDFTKKEMLSCLEAVSFVPESVPIDLQLVDFQRNKRAMALVVDEYGDIQGLVTVKDLLEEIVGEFAEDVESKTLVETQQDGSYLVQAHIAVRDLNRLMQWQLPTDRGNTLAGLIIDSLQTIPRSPVSLRIDGHPMEVVKLQRNRIQLVRLLPHVRRDEDEAAQSR